MKNFISIFAVIIAGASLPADTVIPMPSGKAEFSHEKKGTALEEAFQPSIQGNTIVSGTKELLFDNGGLVKLSSQGIVFAQIHGFFRGENPYLNQTEWLTPGKSQEYRNQETKLIKLADGFDYTGFLTLKTGADTKVTWKQYTQKTTLLTDGLVRFEAEGFPCPDSRIDLKWNAFWITIPYKYIEGEYVELSGVKHKILAGGKGFSAWREDEFKLVAFAGNPEREFIVTGKKGTDCSEIGVLFLEDHLRISVSPLKSGKVSCNLDLRHGTAKQAALETRGGIDFKKVENLILPDISSGNLIANPSFEQGLKGYCLSVLGEHSKDYNARPFTLDRDHARSGKNSLKIQIVDTPKGDFRVVPSKTDNLSSANTVLAPGSYTCSFYAKGDSADAVLNVWVNRFSAGSKWWVVSPNAKIAVKPEAEWKRYSFPFEVTHSDPVRVNFNASSQSGKGFVWVDDFQIETGDKMTEFKVNPAESELVTSAASNFIPAKEKINAKLRVSSKGKGTAAVTIKNYFNEVVFTGEYPFSGNSVIDLPIDGKLGKGIFMVRIDYAMSDGRKCYDLNRFAVADFLENNHKHKKLFSNMYGGHNDYPNLLDILARYQKVGIGAESHIDHAFPGMYALYENYGVEVLEQLLLGYTFGLPKTPRAPYFAILNNAKLSKSGRVVDGTAPDSAFLRDYKYEGYSDITPEYLEKFKAAIVKWHETCPEVKIVRFSNELLSTMPVEEWSNSNDKDEAARKIAALSKIFIETLKARNPNIKLMTDTPCNTRPDGGIGEIDRLLRETNKLGVKFDIVGSHPYRFSPENPDLDSDIAYFIKILEKRGYGDAPLSFGESMHWGPYEIPAWGTQISSWAGSPKTWQCGTLSFDMGHGERLSAEWRARSWLVALKYADRIITMNSGNYNNFDLDINLTPRASQMVSNTLGNLLGNAAFKKDVRFAPFIRAYIFEDEKKRPVAAVWCHKPEVDEGLENAPKVEADFGGSLEGVFDIMNQERAFHSGNLVFPVMSSPLFFRGKPGTLSTMIRAFDNAVVFDGNGIAPVMAAAKPIAPDKASVALKNFLSREFKGSLDGVPVAVPGNGESAAELPLPEKLVYDRATLAGLKTKLVSDKAEYDFDLSFHGMLMKHAQETADFASLDWTSLPSFALNNYIGKKDNFAAKCKAAWNRKGLFLEIDVTDATFVHEEFKETAARWDNDALQFYIDPLCDARSRTMRAYDENDYAYAVFPNSAGTGSIVWRERSADQQLGLGIAAPKDNTIAEDIPSSFAKTKGGYIYRVFVPAKYLLPARLEKGSSVGLGINVCNVDDPAKKLYQRRCGSISNSTEPGKDCWNKPHLWPAFLLWE